MIETRDVVLPHGVTLSCRVAGPEGAPVLVFLHGFPEAAFVWDGLLAHFAGRFRCVAPNLRGYERSTTPAGVEPYRAKHLVADLRALVLAFGSRAAAVVAHDWGGAVAWTFAATFPDLLERLIIVNSPHPAVFQRELVNNPAQQAASAYMNDFCEPDAEHHLQADDFAQLWSLFARMGAMDPSRPGGGWLTDAVRDQYRAVWSAGLTGPLNYYRASPLRPPTAPDSAVRTLTLSAEAVTVRVPVHVVWGEADAALPPSLLDGLEAFVPRLTIARVPGATHWIVHEQPARVAAEIEAALAA
ncbi:alpha/beta fold hydrolase [Rhizobacter sp. Root1221]|uniref:alpha/beta fold hydrolase n=1 Tax=Rhizobacter sp. Root1221 TaxID=1736433 RepID=UPI0006F79FEC|nr:alpha/beta fold hydrolase [Rhizobacter sp. Root1221]KQW01354.1 alpha/beta hydrolase [Rhizobacter sp. Root1221]